MNPYPDRQSLLRSLPKVHALIESEGALSLLREHPRSVVVRAVREAVESARRRIQDENDGSPPGASPESLLEDARAALSETDMKRLRRVINGTGIVIHTNLGRVPLAQEAAQAAYDAAIGYSNLELDLATGKRGGRGGEVEPLLRELTGAEASLVVNNNAAAVLLAISALASGGEVVISRGELVEIGGAFRIPDVIRQSGSRLVEVGATNRTHLPDYERAITPETRLLLKVHASNYRIVGFTAEVPLAKLAALAHERGLVVMNDLGSGALVDLAQFGLPREPTVAEAIAAGADIATVSGDKLLGGPQCGIILGKAEHVHSMGRHPLFRALRADKMTLAALEATLQLYHYPDRLRETLPVLRMLAQSPDALETRASHLLRLLADIPEIECLIEDGAGFAGGGSLPECEVPTKLVTIASAGTGVDRLSELLRRGRPAVICAIAHNRLRLDMRTISDDDVPRVADALSAALRRAGAGSGDAR